jgi:hypothetical protein
MMSDNNDYLRTGANRNFRLRADVLGLMLKGAGYAAVFCLVACFAITAIYWVGGLLPDESRETEDPTPFSFLLKDQVIKQV